MSQRQASAVHRRDLVESLAKRRVGQSESYIHSQSDAYEVVRLAYGRSEGPSPPPRPHRGKLPLHLKHSAGLFRRAKIDAPRHAQRYRNGRPDSPEPRRIQRRGRKSQLRTPDLKSSATLDFQNAGMLVAGFLLTRFPARAASSHPITFPSDTSITHISPNQFRVRSRQPRADAPEITSRPHKRAEFGLI
ncbi:hypothetical protein PSPO01_07819 [Paraphaeosphaeria sporulosa]